MTESKPREVRLTLETADDRVEELYCAAVIAAMRTGSADPIADANAAVAGLMALRERWAPDPTDARGEEESCEPGGAPAPGRWVHGRIWVEGPPSSPAVDVKDLRALAETIVEGLAERQWLDAYAHHSEVVDYIATAILGAAGVERGPAEGASDAVPFDVNKISEAIRRLGKRPAGEASPAGEMSVDKLRALAGEVAGLATGEAGPFDGPQIVSYALISARSAIDDARHSMLTRAAERDEARSKLRALSLAVEAEMESLRGPGDVGERVARRVRLRAALDAAKGDAPTASPTTPEPDPTTHHPMDDTNEGRARAAGFIDPAPEAPDSPGWSNLHDRALTVALAVERFAEGGGDWASLNKATERLREALKWGGRCTRSASEPAPESQDITRD